MADLVSIPSDPRFQDLTGQRFGRLVAISYAGRRGNNHGWLCRCDCGVWSAPLGSNLTRGNTSSCGCLHREATGNKSRAHGRHRTTEYNIHASMIARCYRATSVSFPNYGGRGIKVCDRWRFGEDGKSGFECFFEDVGKRPSKDYSIDRRNNDGDYEPGNVGWATRSEQMNNSRRWKRGQ